MNAIIRVRGTFGEHAAKDVKTIIRELILRHIGEPPIGLAFFITPRVCQEKCLSTPTNFVGFRFSNSLSVVVFQANSSLYRTKN